MGSRRVPLDVLAVMRQEGNVIPKAVFKDGERFDITRIIGIMQIHPAGVPSVAPLRYTVVIEGRIKEIYYESSSGKWFSVIEI